MKLSGKWLVMSYVSCLGSDIKVKCGEYVVCVEGTPRDICKQWIWGKVMRAKALGKGRLWH